MNKKSIWIFYNSQIPKLKNIRLSIQSLLRVKAVVDAKIVADTFLRSQKDMLNEMFSRPDLVASYIEVLELGFQQLLGQETNQLFKMEKNDGFKK